MSALTGTRSLFVGIGNVTLRIARTSGATKLLFRARLLSAPQEAGSISSYIQALDAGSSANASQLVESWPLDPNLSTSQSQVSLPQEVSLKLPPGSSDLMLSLASASAIWLDAVHTE